MYYIKKIAVNGQEKFEVQSQKDGGEVKYYSQHDTRVQAALAILDLEKAPVASKQPAVKAKTN